LAHGCNCAGVMGKGIALEFKRRFPNMYAAYRQQCLQGEFKLGDVFVWRENGFMVFNLATQKRPGSTAEISAIEKSLSSMVELCKRLNIEKVGLPRIGAGLGKLDWEIVKEVVERIGASTTVTLLVFELNQATLSS
ncbi:MAG: macro domain-containing protein, partial [Anaerolineae bacterium]|nr:macro domain-containing protein [Anaerolineae bacterium]